MSLYDEALMVEYDDLLQLEFGSKMVVGTFFIGISDKNRSPISHRIVLPTARNFCCIRWLSNLFLRLLALFEESVPDGRPVCIT